MVQTTILTTVILMVQTSLNHSNPDGPNLCLNHSNYDRPIKGAFKNKTLNVKLLFWSLQPTGEKQACLEKAIIVPWMFSTSSVVSNGLIWNNVN